VLAYSGDAEASAGIGWLTTTRHAVVTALVLDLGQPRELEELRLRALASGATRAHVLDVRDDFARDCILPALRTGADPCMSRGNTLAYPLIARKLVEVAAIEQATAVAHGGSAAAHEAIAAAVAALNPRLMVIAAAREARREHASTRVPAEAPVPPAFGAALKVDCSLWGRTVSRPSAPTAEPLPETVYVLTRSLARTPDIPAHVEIAFEDGVPVSVNGVPMRLVELIESVATIAGNHGIGRSNLPGTAGVCEAPAAVVLTKAHQALAGAGRKLASGIVRMKLLHGEHVIVGHSPVPVEAAAALVNQHS
jgi:argininosuccinate synthase